MPLYPLQDYSFGVTCADVQFEEIRTEEAHHDDETLIASSKPGFSGPKFGPSEEDPTGGEWHRTKTMEIWLNTTHPLTEPKWSRGNLRDNIDPSSLFQNIIHIIDPNSMRLRTVLPPLLRELTG
jgi:hypothetical protein